MFLRDFLFMFLRVSFRKFFDVDALDCIVATGPFGVLSFLIMRPVLFWFISTIEKFIISSSSL
jgi:uncharacterized MnhB-related membrane protein